MGSGMAIQPLTRTKLPGGNLTVGLATARKVRSRTFGTGRSLGADFGLISKRRNWLPSLAFNSLRAPGFLVLGSMGVAIETWLTRSARISTSSNVFSCDDQV